MHSKYQLNKITNDLVVHQIACFKDNYIYISENKKNNEAFVVDPGDAQAVLAFVKENNINLKWIICTHHHWDHIDGIKEIKEACQATVVASSYDQHRIPCVDKEVKEGDQLKVNSFEFSIKRLDGHTIGHICYHDQKNKVLFIGDTLFAMGCGRLFEGSPKEMLNSLNYIKSLDPQTLIFCTHEYSLTNALFSIKVDPENTKLQNRLERIKEKRKNEISTVPFLLQNELETNPFLRSNDLGLQRRHKKESEIALFTYIRELRNKH